MSVSLQPIRSENMVLRTYRFPRELDAALEERARLDETTKSALLREGAELIIALHAGKAE